MESVGKLRALHNLPLSERMYNDSNDRFQKIPLAHCQNLEAWSNMLPFENMDFQTP